MPRARRAGDLSPGGWLGVGVAAGFLLLAGCASRGPAPPPPPVEPQPPRLVDPLAGYPLVVGELRQGRLRGAYDSLLASGDADAAESAVRQMLAEDPGFHPASVLLADVQLLRDEPARALEVIAPVADELPGYTAAQLVRASAAERLDDVVIAYDAYREAASGSTVAARRSRELRERALVEVGVQLRAALDRRRLDEAERALARLEKWAVGEVATLQARQAVLRQRGDLEAEAEVLRQLVAQAPEDRSSVERLADVELELGELTAALARLEGLVEIAPEDAALVEKLERAKFRWRLRLLPEEVQALFKAPELTRSELASLLYWLVPEVRYAALEDPPIATDILDHPRREEVVRVLDLGLMEVDETLHTFRPDRPIRRAAALLALLRLMADSELDLECLRPADELRRPMVPYRACTRAARCGLIAEWSDCLPEAALSGSEAVELFRRTLDLLEAP